MMLEAHGLTADGAAEAVPDYIAMTLWISSDSLTPEEITSATGVSPTSVRVKGSLIPQTGKLRRPEFDQHEWSIREKLLVGTPEEVWQRSGNFISSFLARLQPAATQIRALSKDHSVRVVYAYFLSFVPYNGVSPEDIQMIAALGAGLDFDGMVYENESAEGI
jgi:hypothetical protein